MVRSKARLLALVFAIALAAGPDGGRAETAERNYRLYCVQCHGTRATGEGINNTAGALAVSPRDHTSVKDMSKLSDEDLRLAITRGGDAVSKSELMPPWGGVLTAREIDGLVLYLRKLCACEGRK
jgi:mono/diheme cytochrome c family protein